MSAISNNKLRSMPVDVANRGAIHDLDRDSAVEVPCAIDSNGARAAGCRTPPGQIRELVLQVKEFERITVSAALQGSRSLAIDALTANTACRKPRVGGDACGRNTDELTLRGWII